MREFVMSYNHVSKKVIRYSSKEQAENQGIDYVVISASTEDEAVKRVEDAVREEVKR